MGELSYSLHDLPLEERPRERLMSKGGEALALSELLAILLGSGTQGKSVLSLAQEIISRFRGIDGLLEASVEELMEIKGIGEAKAITLQAAFHFALRARESVGGESLQGDRKYIAEPNGVYQLIRSHLKREKKEVFVVLLRDVKRYVYRRYTISMGILDQVLVHPRELFHEAIRHRAKSLIMAHNHPSGDPEPSESDIALTQKLCEAGKLLGLSIDDHLIVGREGYVSFWERGLLKRRGPY